MNAENWTRSKSSIEEVCLKWQEDVIVVVVVTTAMMMTQVEVKKNTLNKNSSEGTMNKLLRSTFRISGIIVWYFSFSFAVIMTHIIRTLAPQEFKILEKGITSIWTKLLLLFVFTDIYLSCKITICGYMKHHSRTRFLPIF